MRLRLLLALCILTIACSAWGAAAAPFSQQPIQIKSSELYTDSVTKTATFVGKVVARQGDLTIFSDRLVVHYKEKGGDVDRVEANGSVRIIQGDRRGEAEHALYDAAAGTIVLDGSPKVFQGNNVVAGKVITYYVREQKSVVSGGNGRVNATIYPRGKGPDADRK